MIEHDTQDIPAAKLEDYNVMIGVKNFLDQPIKNDIETNENIRKITADEGDD